MPIALSGMAGRLPVFIFGMTLILTWRQLANGGLDLPLDEPALFAGRHHGVLQDARDYLAWEEDLPSEIDEINP